MDADRELFIQQLVAALQENTALAGGVPSLSPRSPGAADGGSSSDSSTEGEKSPQQYTGLFLSESYSTLSGNTERLARNAYKQLQFDFPQLQEASINALAELYRRVSAEKSTQLVAAEIPITATLLDGVAFLNDQSPSYGSNATQTPRSSESSALLAASLFLLVFRLCLESPEDPRVEKLLSSLEIKRSQQQTRKTETSSNKPVQEEAESELEEKYAAQEDPDDLSQVYEGQLPEPQTHVIPMWNHQTSAISSTLRIDKLRYLVSCTFSSSFEGVSMEKWEQWRLEDELVVIMRLLVGHPPENDDKIDETEKDKRNTLPATLYGPIGEWSRYLYVLRDRVLRFPGASRNALWRLKELIEFLQRHQTAANPHHGIQPQHLLYRVLAELAISREFHQSGAQRAQQGLSLVIQELLPFITQEIHQLVQVSSAAEADDGDELVVVFLQLLHFMLFASSNARTTTEKLHESGMLRTLLMLLPASDTDKTQAVYLEKRWLPALLRLLGECALWHAGFAVYISRVPKFVKLLPTLREPFVAEELVLGLAFHQHQVAISVKMDIWGTFVSESLFPLKCESYLDAMKKLQDAVFVLDCLEKALVALRPAMQKELQRSLQPIYIGFARSFEYPTFAAAEAARQQEIAQQALSLKEEDDKEKKEEDRGQAEALQFTALRNKLRQSVKSLLSALSSGFVGGRASSKLD
ncbi:hypothetical protein PPTG_04551 [Phytophthora nicotianae INRA-310]|uniref:Uncharacterized protein n=3 Tax=Phytophthora nicotianae TaxID=4792 RepID=W2R142_PHYN3|nr:hypothetical protein PPTG_04551 [Phytophthora nicotianae INRA-310]ETN19162.1 hypothetical protein PPTG_04551 [Phytophthora nicotianae INRA-310]